MEPLIPSILSCLEHRNSFVRKSAVLAINALYKLPKGEHLLQDAPELIEKVGQGIKGCQKTFQHPAGYLNAAYLCCQN